MLQLLVVWKKTKSQDVIVVIFFIVYLLLGGFIFKDYGISWDEDIQRITGHRNFNYVFQKDQSFLGYDFRFYGPFFTLLLTILERVFSIEDIRNVYFMRHFITFIIFYISLIVFYFLLKRIFKDWKKALLGCAILILSPRIFADSFYNPKDLPIMSFFIFSSYTLILILEKATWKRIFLHGIICASAIAIRPLGLIFPVVTVLILFINVLIINKNIYENVAKTIVYILITGSITLLFWPFLWTNPIYNFIIAIKSFSYFSLQKNLQVLYLGNLIPASALPWHYIPIWIFITTPLSYTFLFFSGIIKLIKECTINKNIKKINQTHKIEIIVLILLICPIAAVIALKSILYDGWRHLYFIYPFMVIIMIKGVSSVPKLLFIPLFVEIVTVVIFMVQFHPYQNLYFNMLLSRDMEKVKNNFELDYWGLSYRKALEYILKIDKSPIIPLVVANGPGSLNSFILTPSDRKRLKYLSEDEIKQAKYFIGNYRWHKEDYNHGKEIYSIKIGNTKIMVVEKL